MIKGELIWITGASSGIGRAIAIMLAQQGNTIFASARDEKVLSDLAASQANIIPVVFDISCASQIEAVREQIQQHTPYLDRVILNAGNCEYFDIEHPDWDIMRRVMAVNYLGAINTLASALPLLQARPDGKGHIVGVVSLATLVPFARAEAYGASKAALQYFYDSLRLDLVVQGIDVTVVNPGFIKTPLTDRNNFPMPFLQPVDKSAQRIIRAIEQRRRQFDFPRRLKYLLKFLGFFPAVWNKFISPWL
ncbi:MAG: SDR family NAD(P)-dependent oxidoreductase [Spongiibacteraceae bacterium]